MLIIFLLKKKKGENHLNNVLIQFHFWDVLKIIIRLLKFKYLL